MSVIQDDKEMKVEFWNGLVIVTLRRPDSLNALSLEMIRLLSAGLARWEMDPVVRAVLIRGEGDRAFCAGGDVKAVYAMGMRYRREEPGSMLPTMFFGEEYLLNRRMHHFKKPLVAFMNGIVMGGGYGIAASCPYRVATARTKFAMPEVGIGFFPDVGSTWFLSRCPGQTGAYIALTGETIGVGDMLHTGLATHYMAPGEDDFEMLCAALVIARDPADVFNTRFKGRPAERGVIEANRAVIDECFAGAGVEDILEKLGAHGTPWAAETMRTIGRRAPVSLKVSLAHLRQAAADQDFDDVIARDYVLVQHFLNGHDFYEGIRAQVIDRDRNPRWEPGSLADVREGEIARYFVPTGKTLADVAL